MSSSSAVAGLTRFGKLWGKGHETFTTETRRILSVKGVGATKFLNGLLTCDLFSEPAAPRFNYEPNPDIDDSYPNPTFTSSMRSACFLDIKGRIVSLIFIWVRVFLVNLNPSYLHAP
jgi:folate-binding Fe-S cluster repair protein YgfZ